jgi:hypothetical protein
MKTPENTAVGRTGLRLLPTNPGVVRSWTAGHQGKHKSASVVIDHSGFQLKAAHKCPLDLHRPGCRGGGLQSR